MSATINHPHHVEHPPSQADIEGWIEDAAIAIVFACGATLAAVILVLLVLF